MPIISCSDPEYFRFGIHFKKVIWKISQIGFADESKKSYVILNRNTAELLVNDKVKRLGENEIKRNIHQSRKIVGSLNLFWWDKNIMNKTKKEYATANIDFE